MKQVIDPEIAYFTYNNKNYVKLRNFIFELDEVGLPIIYCDEWRSGLKFYCPFCKTIHKHGFGNGWRVPHCTDWDNPFWKLGQYCIILKKETKEVLT